MDDSDVLAIKARAIGFMLGEFGDLNTLMADAIAEMGVDMANGELVVNRTTDYGRITINGVPVEIQIKLTTQTGEMVNPGGPIAQSLVFPNTLPDGLSVR